jgi:putative ABC transport system permease protein
MNRPRTHKIISDLWSNRTRSLLVVASITVGLFALGVIATIDAVLRDDMQAGYAASNPANIQFNLRSIDDDLIESIRKLEGVRDAEGLRIFNMQLQASADEWVTIAINASPDYGHNQIGQVRLVEGKWPPAKGEIVIERYKLPDTHAQVGDLVTLELPSGRTRQLKLVGVVHDQTVGAFAVGPGFFLAPVQGYVIQDTLDELGQTATQLYTVLRVTVDTPTDDVAYIRQIANRVRNKIDANDGEVISLSVRGSFDHPNRTYVDALAGVLLLLGGLVLFLSGFLITNTLQALLNQQVQQIGIIKTLGGQRRQIISLYMLLIFFYGLVAAGLSIPLAYRVGFQRLEGLATTLNFVFRGRRLTPWVVGLQMAMALIAPQLAALVPILQGSRISVQEALSGIIQSAQTGSGWLDQRITRLRRLPRPLLIAIRNTFRKKGRLILTLFTLTMGGAIFIAAFNVQVSMQNYVEQVSKYFLADVNLTMDRPYRIAEIQKLLADMPQVARIEGWAYARSEMILADGSTGDSVQLQAPPANSTLVEPVMLSGRWIRPGDTNAIVLNERFHITMPDLKVGDTMRLRVNGKERDWIVIGFFQMVGKSVGYIAYANYDYLSALIQQPNKAIAFRIRAAQPGLSEEQQKALGREIENRLAQRGIKVSEVTAGQWLSTTAANGFSVLTAFLLFLAGLTALVGSIGLAGTMSMNVMERTREIGIMRAIGANNAILMRMVVFEGTLIGMISWILASLLAFPISKLLSDTISQAMFGLVSRFGVTPLGFIIWLVAAIVLSILASVLPANHATHLTIREVLAHE